MGLLLVVQYNTFEGSLFWPFLIVVSLAIVIWLLSWLLFPDPVPAPKAKGLDGIRGLDEEMSARLRTFGIHSDRDLVRLTQRGQQDVERELKLQPGQYDDWRQQILERWRVAYLPPEFRDVDAIYPDPELGPLYRDRPVEADDLSKLEGVDQLTANRMNAAGIFTLQQLRAFTPEQQANFKNRFGLTGFRFDALPADARVRTAVSAQESSEDGGALDRSSGHDSSAMSAVASVTNATKTASVENTANPSATQSSKVFVAEGVAGDSGIPKSISDDELGRIYSASPPHRDRLSRLDGIDEAAELRLNEAGVYTVDQLLSLSPHQQTRFKQRFELPNVDFASWRNVDSSSGAAATHAVMGETIASEGTSGAVDQPASEATLPKEVVFPGESEKATTPPAARDIGYVYLTPPKDSDDLSQLAGVDSDLAAKMNAAGVYRYHQLQTMSPTQHLNFVRQFGLPENSMLQWTSILANAKQSALDFTKDSAPELNTTNAVPQVQSDSSNGPSAAVGFATGDPANVTLENSGDDETRATKTAKTSDWGPVYATAPADVDSLSRLQGIDSAAAERLNQLGVYRFEQLRELDSRQLARLSDAAQLESIDFADWRRCIHAWSRGIETEAAEEATYPIGQLHGIELPEVADGVFDGERLVAYSEQVVFRGSDPAKWGQAVDAVAGEVLRSIPLEDVRTDINYVRIRRLDTRESVVTAITKGQLFGSGPDAQTGWNGSCEQFFDGRHLGVFAAGIPNEVDTRYGVGGWGLGHRFDHNDPQEWGWAGRLIEPTKFEISVGRIGSSLGTVVFRSNDPTIWNQDVNAGSLRYAMPIDRVKHAVNFVRLCRVDTGEAVIAPVQQADLLTKGLEQRVGWNGQCDEFSGGYHLGIYHVDAPQDVEICFGEGGWGFGHPFGENDRQAFGWGGISIESPTVFEISLLKDLPGYLRHELLT